MAMRRQPLPASEPEGAISISSPSLPSELGPGGDVFYHSDVDALHANVIAAGYRPDAAPRDAEWGERFFHLTDPDGHELD